MLADTDSWMHEIETENSYEDFNKDKELFDFVKYSKESNHHDKTNNLIVGKMEDGTSGVFIKSFRELKVKMYSYTTGAKGIYENIYLCNRDWSWM